MSSLPNELLLLVVPKIETEADLYSIAQTNRLLYKAAISHLYQRNVASSQGSALLYAVQKGILSTARRAIQAGANVNMKTPPPDNRPLLSIAAENGHLGLVQLLLNASADVNAIDGKRRSPLLLAADFGHAQIVELLLDHGADPNHMDCYQSTALYFSSISGHAAVVNILLAHDKIDVNVYDREGETPISAAARECHIEIVEALLAHSANPGLRHLKSQIAIHSAVMREQIKLLRLLVNRDDVDPNAWYQGQTPLQLAVHKGRDDLVEILLTDPRVNPDLSVSPTGQTPLLHAAMLNNSRIVRLLLDAGANPRIMDRMWLSAAMLLNAPSAEARINLIQEHALSGSEGRRSLYSLLHP